MFKLAAFDMDGTLLNEADEISQANMEALKKLMNKGCQIVLASGRQDFLLKEYIKRLEISGPVISCNGAVIRNPLTHVFIQSETLSKSIVKQLLELCLAGNHHYMVYTSDVILASRNPKAEFFLKRNKQLDEECQIPILFDVDPECISRDYEVNKVLILEYDEGRFGTLDAKLKKIHGIHYCQSNHGHMDIMREGVSKGNALRVLAHLNGIQPEEIVAFGDNHNDYEMLEFAGCAIAMGNSVDELKRISDFISVDHNHDGVAYAVNRYLLRK